MQIKKQQTKKQVKAKNSIKDMQPYKCSRDIYSEGIFLDANEAYEEYIEIDWARMIDLNRYPSASADRLREKLVEEYVNTVGSKNIILGNGSDELIEMIIKTFAQSDEKVMAMKPSFSMYSISAQSVNIGVVEIPLKEDFSLDIDQINAQISNVKVMFICNPNNPTGNLVSKEEIKKILEFFDGILVVDEAYIEFAGLEYSVADWVKTYPNLIVLRTFSKAWGLAGIRLGYAIADWRLISQIQKIKPPFNVNRITQEVGYQALNQVDKMFDFVRKVNDLKKNLEAALKKMGLKLLPTKTNFILLRIPSATQVYKNLANKGLIIRDRSKLPLLSDVLRITVGSEEENRKLIKLLKQIL
jgi:histidinol-phosphate aminotransferase